MIQAILFAANGVLAETHDIHFESLNKALAPHGFEITADEDARIYRGLPTKQKLELLTVNKGLSPSLHGTIRSDKQVMTIEAIDRQVELDLQKIDLLSCAKDSGLKIGVCSNSPQSTLVAMMQAMGIYPYVDICVGSDLGLLPKPAPDMYLHATEMLGVPIERSAIVERSKIGIQAAKASGCPTIVRVKACEDVMLGLMSFLIPNQPIIRYA